MYLPATSLLNHFSEMEIEGVGFLVGIGQGFKLNLDSGSGTHGPVYGYRVIQLAGCKKGRKGDLEQDYHDYSAWSNRFFSGERQTSTDISFSSNMVFKSPLIIQRLFSP